MKPSNEDELIERLVDILARFSDDYEVAPNKNDHEFWSIKANFTAKIILNDTRKYFTATKKEQS